MQDQRRSVVACGSGHSRPGVGQVRNSVAYACRFRWLYPQKKAYDHTSLLAQAL